MYSGGAWRSSAAPQQHRTASADTDRSMQHHFTQHHKAIDAENVTAPHINRSCHSSTAGSVVNSTALTDSVLRKVHQQLPLHAAPSQDQQSPHPHQQQHQQHQPPPYTGYSYHQAYTNTSSHSAAHPPPNGTSRYPLSTVPVTTGAGGTYRQSNSIYKKEVPFRIRPHTVLSVDHSQSSTAAGITSPPSFVSSAGQSSLDVSTGTVGGAAGGRGGYVPLTVNIESNFRVRGARSSNLTLRIELTFEAEPCFLYSLDITEIDFRRIKAEQRLLVEFEEFAGSIINLLEECSEAASHDSAKINCIFSTHSEDSNAANTAALYSGGRIPTPASYGQLRVVEKNQFKELTHLCLVLLPGDDGAVREHLKYKLEEARNMAAGFKDKSSSLSSQNASLTALHVDLQNQLRLCQQQCDERIAAERSAHSKEVDKMTSDHLEAIKAMTLKADKAETRGATLNEQLCASNETIRSLRQEWQTSHQAHKDAASELEAIKIAFDPLKEAKQVSDSQNEELNARLDATQQELANVHTKLSRAEANAGIASSSKHAVVAQAQDLESKLGEAAREIKRGNEIIAKQRIELKTLKTRQKSAGELEDKVMTLTKDLLPFESTKTQLAAVSAELTEAKALLSKKQKIIETLNKQLTSFEVNSILQNFDAAKSTGYSLGGTSTGTDTYFDHSTGTDDAYYNHMDAHQFGTSLGHQQRYTIGAGYPFRKYVVDGKQNGDRHLMGSAEQLPDRPSTSPARDYDSIPDMRAGGPPADLWAPHHGGGANIKYPTGTQHSAKSYSPVEAAAAGVRTGGMTPVQDDELFAARPAGGGEDDPLPVPIRHHK